MIKDKRTIKAKQEGLRARSAYKLKDLNRKFNLFKGAHHVIDLGSWPGGWSLVASEYCSVTAVDRIAMLKVPKTEFIKADLFADDLLDKLPEADVVLSDAAPNTAGDSRDQYKSFLLAMRALEIAVAKLRPGGNFVAKIFQGEDFDEFLHEVRKHFKLVKSAKPDASKKESKEMYIVGRDFKKSIHSPSK